MAAMTQEQCSPRMAAMQKELLTSPTIYALPIFRFDTAQLANKNLPFYNARTRRNAKGLDYSSMTFSARQWRLKSQPRVSSEIRRKAAQIMHDSIANFSLQCLADLCFNHRVQVSVSEVNKEDCMRI